MSSSLLRSLVRQCLLAEAPRKNQLRWKFHPDRVIDGDYNRAWTGVEEIKGLLFRIKTETQLNTRQNNEYLSIVLSAYLSSDPTISFDHVVDVVNLDIDLVARFRLLGQRLREQIARRNFETDFQIKHHLSRRQFDWRPGVWSVPGLGKIRGDRLDLGPFKILIPRDFDQTRKVFVIGRDEFQWSGPLKVWVVGDVSRIQNFVSVRYYLEKIIEPICDLDRFDDEEYLAEVFKNFVRHLALEAVT